MPLGVLLKGVWSKKVKTPVLCCVCLRISPDSQPFCFLLCCVPLPALWRAEVWLWNVQHPLILATKFFGCFCMGLHVLKEKKETFLAFLPLQYNTVCINFQQKVLIQWVFGKLGTVKAGHREQRLFSCGRARVHAQDSTRPRGRACRGRGLRCRNRNLVGITRRGRSS